MVCSEQAHSSVDKAARLLDMQIRKVPADAAFRMRADLCAEAVARGTSPLVVATVGTTSTTSVDPVEAIAAIAHAAGAWLHVDAAYAGSSRVCPETRSSAAGVASADSLVVNPHKWLFTPMDCSVLWTSRPDALRDAFSLVPEYLRTNDDADSLSDYGPALGRRFRALKLWAVIRAYGRHGLQVRIREAIRLAALFEGWVGDAPGWELCAPRPFSVVCFRMDGSDEHNAVLWIASTPPARSFLTHQARRALRPADGDRHERTREADVARAWRVIQREAAPRDDDARPGDRLHHMSASPTIRVIGMPMDLGQSRRGVDMGPSAIRHAGLHERLRSSGVCNRRRGNVEIPERATLAAQPDRSFLSAVVDGCTAAYDAGAKAIADGRFPIFLGGDHSMSAGTVGGVSTAGPIGLLWIDAHADANTPETSPTGNIHGMPLAALMGLGAPSLVNLGRPGPKIPFARVALIGLRDVDPGERLLLRDHGVAAFTMTDVDEHGGGRSRGAR